jgi:hypothetical protein
MTVADLVPDPEPPAGPTPMRRAHADGMRKTVARVKAWLKPGQDPDAAVKAALLSYLGEWNKMYGVGAGQTRLTSTERTILTIRQDTIQQLLTELER